MRNIGWKLTTIVNVYSTPRGLSYAIVVKRKYYVETHCALSTHIALAEFHVNANRVANCVMRSCWHGRTIVDLTLAGLPTARVAVNENVSSFVTFSRTALDVRTRQMVNGQRMAVNAYVMALRNHRATVAAVTVWQRTWSPLA